MPLRIGRISYLNVAPYFQRLKIAGLGEVVAGVPAELNTMLAAGTIDACPSSSFEYALHADDYLLLPGHSISSVGPVYSVLLFTPGSLDQLNGGAVAITGESATSINLLKVLLHEFCGVDAVTLRVPAEPVEEHLHAGRSALLIGDRALAAAKDCPSGCQITDLGALWYHFTGLPFVFALWILRREAVARSTAQFQVLSDALFVARRAAFAGLDEMAAELAAGSPFSARQLADYWRGMSYDLTDAHLEGLTLFFTLCHKRGLLERVPALHFFPST
jgi:chorismate dehydratase